MIKSAKCKRSFYLMNCIKIVSFVMRKKICLNDKKEKA